MGKLVESDQRERGLAGKRSSVLLESAVLLVKKMEQVFLAAVPKRAFLVPFEIV